MGAIVTVREKNLAAEVASSCSSGLLFKVADSPGVCTDDPLIIPASSVHRSVEVWLRLFFGPVGPFTSLTAPKFYADGANGLGAGVTLYARTTNPGTYSTPSTPANDSAGTDAFTYTAASPKALDVANAGPFSGSNTDFGDYIVLWMTITTAALSQGKPAEFRLPIEQLFFTYSET